jgi:hypothetical protein
MNAGETHETFRQESGMRYQTRTLNFAHLFESGPVQSGRIRAVSGGHIADVVDRPDLAEPILEGKG